MALLSLKETYPNYREDFSAQSLSHLDDYSVYASDDDKVGSIDDGLFDSQTGRFRYLIVDTGLWIFGKKILLPLGRARFEDVFGHCKNRVHAITTFLALLELVNRQDVKIAVGEIANFFWIEAGTGGSDEEE